MGVLVLLPLMLIAQTLGWAREQIIFPDPVVINQRGESIHFHDLIKGKTVIIDFIFTSCTIVCRPLTGNLRRVQTELGSEILNDVQFVSVSVDPTRDTPSVLNSFARTFRLPQNWSLVTGSKGDIAAILKASGVYTSEPNYHTARVIIGSEATGWTRFYGLSSPVTLAEAVRRAVQKRMGGDHE